MTAAALLVALALRASPPARGGAPEPPPREADAAVARPDAGTSGGGDADAGARDPDAEVIEDLEVLQRLELLQHLELFDDSGDEPR